MMTKWGLQGLKATFSQHKTKLVTSGVFINKTFEFSTAPLTIAVGVTHDPACAF